MIKSWLVGLIDYVFLDFALATKSQESGPDVTQDDDDVIRQQLFSVMSPKYVLFEFWEA